MVSLSEQDSTQKAKALPMVVDCLYRDRKTTLLWIKIGLIIFKAKKAAHTIPGRQPFNELKTVAYQHLCI